MLRPEPLNTIRKLTTSDLELLPRKLPSPFIGFICEQVIFLPCIDQPSSSQLFDKICLLARQLKKTVNVERYLPLNEDQPLVIITKDDFQILFDIPESKIINFNAEEKQSLFNQLLGNKSVLNHHNSFRDVLIRMTNTAGVATNPLLSLTIRQELSQPSVKPTVKRQRKAKPSKEKKPDELPSLSIKQNTGPGFFQGKSQALEPVIDLDPFKLNDSPSDMFDENICIPNPLLPQIPMPENLDPHTDDELVFSAEIPSFQH